MATIHNLTKRVLIIPSGGKQAECEPGGSVVVSESEAKAWLKRSGPRSMLEQSRITVEWRAPTTARDKPDSAPPKVRSARDLVEIIKRTNDAESLAKILETDERATVKRAVRARLSELEAE
jgi:hypothetical protein